MKRIFSIIAALAMALALILPAGLVLSQGESGTTLSAYVTATAKWTITCYWSIDKHVHPSMWDLFVGDTGTSKFGVCVIKEACEEEAWVEGEVCVTNGGAVATENLAIVAELRDGVEPPKDLIATATVDVSGNLILDPGETGCYSYRVDIPAGDIHAGGLYKVTAVVTITNHSGHLGEPFGPSPSETTNLPGSPTLINDAINVDDGGYDSDGPYSYSWWTDTSACWYYERKFACTEEGTETYNNTATIRETGQSDTEYVTVYNYALKVAKNAETSFTRTYNWIIDKWADQTELTLAIGEQFLVNYEVCVNATYTDSDFLVTGGISVSNPAPVAADIIAASDEVSPDILATLDLLVTLPYTLDAGAEDVELATYTADLPDKSDRINAATVTIQNYDYSWDGSATASGTHTFSGTANVDFSTAEMEEVDECIDVSDTYAGSLGTVCYGVDPLPKCFLYSRWIGPYDTCGDYTVENIASFVTNDLGVTGSDSWTVSVHVPCGGCTLTIGYWKTHSEFGPAPYDDTWALLASGASTPFFLSSQSWYQVLWTPPTMGNAYYILAFQYIGAKLNILNGASSTPAVDAALAWATNFFNSYSPTSTLSKSLRAKAISNASILDQYNMGYIGPGHCSE